MRSDYLCMLKVFFYSISLPILAIKVLLSQVKSDDASNTQLSPPDGPFSLPPHSLNCNSLKRLASRDVWSVQAEQLWLEFLGAPANRNRPVPFVEALPVTLWLNLTPRPIEREKKEQMVVNGAIVKDNVNDSNNHEKESEESWRDNDRGNSQPVTFRVGGESPALRQCGGDGNKVGSQCKSYNDHKQQQSHHLSSSSKMPVLGTSPPFSGSPGKEDRFGTRTSDQNGGQNHDYPRDKVSARESRGNGKSWYNSLDHRQHAMEYNECRNRRFHSEEGEKSPKSGNSASNGSYESGKVQTRNYRCDKANDDMRESIVGQLDRDYSCSSGNQRSRSHQRPSKRDGSAHDSVEDRQRFHRHVEDGDLNYAKGREWMANESAYSLHREQHESRRDGVSNSLQRQDSRSSFNSVRQCDEARERRGRERRLRHSSSSSSEKRDPDTVVTRVAGSRGRCIDVLESRSSAEGQVSSDSIHGMDERHIRKDKPVSVEDHFPSSDKRYFQGGEEEFSRSQEVHRSSSRGRHCSDSPDWGSPRSQTRHRERHLQRSSSRDSRGGRENPKEEVLRRSPRTDVARRPISRDTQAGRRLAREPSRDSSDGRYDSSDQLSKTITKSRKGGSAQGRNTSAHSGEDDCGSGRNSWTEDDANEGMRGGHCSGSGARQHRSQSRGSERGVAGGSTVHRHPFSGRGENPVDIPRPRCITEEVKDTAPRRGPNHRIYDIDSDKDIFKQGGDAHSPMDAMMGSVINNLIDSPGSYPFLEQNNLEDRYRHSQPQSRHGCERRGGGPNIGWEVQQDATSSGWSQQHQRPPPDGCKSSQSQEDEDEEDTDWPNTQQGKKSTNARNFDQKICVLIQVGSKLRIQLNHFQFVFLLRLAESFAAFQNDLSADLLSLASTSVPASQFAGMNSPITATTTTSSSQQATQPSASSIKPSLKQEPPSTIIIPVVLKEVEFAVVCPYQMHQRTFSDDFSILSPFLQGINSGQDAVFGEDGDLNSTSCFPQFVDNISKGRFIPVHT